MLLWKTALLSLVTATLLLGAEEKTTTVTIKGVHLCCGSCSDSADAALEGLKGISKPGNDRNTKIITFQAESKDAAQDALKSLAKEGFYGAATFGKDELKWPESGAKKGEKVATVVIEDVHLCCGSCVMGAKEALEKAPGATEIDIDRTAKKITVRGKEMDEADVIAALNKGGFFGKVHHDKKK